MHEGTWTIERCEYAEVRALAEALEISEVTASVLLRRGYRDVEQARAFFLGERAPHDPFLLGDMAVAVERIRAAIAAGKRICVHGDYDVDGICATALAVLTLRSLGADVQWHLPSRFEEGYGVSRQTLDRLADDGCSLVLTVDCGITAVEEVAEAKARGLEVIVTDHHRPGDTLPDCPIVATRPSDYPFPELCGTGVVCKLAQALGVGRLAVPRPRRAGDDRGRRPAARREPLARDRGPPRARAHAASRSPGADAKRPRRPGCGGRSGRRLPARAADQRGRPARPSGCGARAAAHRTTQRRRAGSRTSWRPSTATARRSRTGSCRAAVAEVESWPEPRRRRRGYVIWGEDWHEGVIGIVASRLVERFNRPVVLIAGTEGDWKGSGRSLPGVRPARGTGRLLGAPAPLRRPPRGSRSLDPAGEPRGLRRGVRRARGCGARRRRSRSGDAHRRDRSGLRAHARPGNGARAARAVRARQPGGDAARARLRRGLSPGVVGEGKHLRFRIRQNGRDAGSAIAFGLGAQLDRLRRPVRYDIACRLKENRWNGTIAPQLVIRRLFDAPDGYEELRAGLVELWRAGDGEWTSEARTIFAELELDDGARRQLYESETFRALLERRPDVALPKAACRTRAADRHACAAGACARAAPCRRARAGGGRA